MRVTDHLPWRNLARFAGTGNGTERRVDPNDPVSVLQSEVDRAFENFWRAMPLPMPFFGNSPWPFVTEPDVDVSDDGKAVTVRVELPGFAQSEVDVSMTGDSLIIRASKPQGGNGNRAMRGWERGPRPIERSVPLPQGIDTNATSASFKDGGLTVVLPRTPDAQSDIKRVKVTG
jgi:HSP20 family protein